MRFLLVILGCILIASGAAFFLYSYRHASVHTPEDPGPAVQALLEAELGLHPRLRGLSEWRRPTGPARVAIQAGHWKAAEAPEEQNGLRKSTGTSGGGVAEWEVALRIAEEVERLLEERGIETEILPTTIPPNYWADAFVSIHADGNENASISGYKVASSRHDYTGRAEGLALLIGEEYERTTALQSDDNITRQMRGYYAFNWRRYDHSLHPMTPAVIIETGFLTNPSDRRFLVGSADVAAGGIAAGIERYLAEQGLMPGE